MKTLQTGYVLTLTYLSLWSADGMAHGTSPKHQLRHIGFQGLSHHLKAATLCLRTDQPIDSCLIIHSQGLEVLSEYLPQWFAKDNVAEDKKSRAKPEIWQKPEIFNQSISSFRDATQTLTKLAKGKAHKRELSQGLQTIADACQTCHKQFRK